MDNNFYLLGNGKKIPAIGFGTWLIDNENAKDAVIMALNSGYNMIDTASFYKNEEGVGKGLALSGKKREEVFLTSKLWNDDHGYDNTLSAFEKSLKKLDTDYLDLYLIHWPVPASKKDVWEEDIVETWKAMEKIYESGRAKAIGVSNFMPHHLKCILDNCDITPMVNQIEYHVSFMQQDTVDYCKNNNILIQAWSPLARGGIFELDEMKEIAHKYDKSVAQICLMWEIQKGIIPIPKTLNEGRMKENLNVFDKKITEADMIKIDNINICSNSGHNPDSINF